MSLQETFHPDVNGHALNVKTHGVSFADGGTEAQRERAWANAQEAWWRDADEAAHAAGYSGATACGRSGGWCAPYSVVPGGREKTVFEDDKNSADFRAFAEKIDALMRAVPERFAAALRDAIAEDEQADREAREASAERARERAILALVPRLVAALRGAVSCHAYAETDGRGLQGDNAAEWRSVDAEARAALAAFDALQSGDGARTYNGRTFTPAEMAMAERGSDAWLAAGSQGRNAAQPGAFFVDANGATPVASQPEAWRVTWESDSDAATPEKAARAALADIRRRGSIAHVFSVRGRDGRVHVVDLNGMGADA